MNTEPVKKTLKHLYVEIPKRLQALYHACTSSSKQHAIYRRKVIDSISESFVLVGFSIFTNVILFLMMKIAWNSYIATPAADHFMTLHPEFVSEISTLVDKPIIMFPVELTLMVFLICIGICTACQLSNTADYFFHTKSKPQRCLFSGLSLTIISGWYLKSTYEIESIYLICTFTALPVFCMFSGCFKITKRLLPDAKTLTKKIRTMIKSLLPKLKQIIKACVDKINT